MPFGMLNIYLGESQKEIPEVLQRKSWKNFLEKLQKKLLDGFQKEFLGENQKKKSWKNLRRMLCMILSANHKFLNSLFSTRVNQHF